MKIKKLLMLALCASSLVVLAACDDDDDNGNGNGTPPPGGTNNPPPATNTAPASIAGSTLTVTINDSTAPFAESGTYLIELGGTAPDTQGTYTLIDTDGTTFGTGPYTYTQGTGNNAVLLLEGTDIGDVTSTLTFDDDNGGTIVTTDSTGGSENSSFVRN